MKSCLPGFAITVVTIIQWVAFSYPPSLARPWRHESAASPEEHDVAGNFGPLPLIFFPNAGQMDSRIRFFVDGKEQRYTFLDDGVDVWLTGSSTKSPKAKQEKLRLRFQGASRRSAVREGQPSGGKLNYLVGRDPSLWRSGLPTYKEVVYRDLYSNVDLVYTGRGDRLESIFTVKPGGRVSDIRVHCSRAKSLKLDGEGNLVMKTASGELQESRPEAYQVVGGDRREVRAKFWVEAKSRTYGFHVGEYDRNHPLIIDPIFGFASYLGGSSDDSAIAIAVDGMGQLYITGSAFSANFPTQSALRPTAAGRGDAFVTKVAANGSDLVYSTYLGGSDMDAGLGIAVDGSGQAHVSGLTFSTDFPVASAFRDFNSGRGDVFVTKLSSSGQAIVYSTYLGGTEFDLSSGIVLDSTGAAYTAGRTFSTNFPIVGAYQGILRGLHDGFVTKLASTGQTLVYSTYLGGSGLDGINSLAVDGAGSTYVTGFTNSGNFPTQSAFQTNLRGGLDAFVTKLAATGGSLGYSTYLGGSEDDIGNSVLVDAAGLAYATGSTRSSDFPIINAYQGSNQGGGDAFLTNLTPAGGLGDFSTYLGGSQQDQGSAVGRDNSGQIYVAGMTSSSDFPLTNALSATLSGLADGFVSEFAPGARSLIFSTYLGGSSSDAASAMVVDGSGKIYLGGETRSSDLATVSAKQPRFAGGIADGFYLRIDPVEPSFVTTLFFPRLATNGGTSGTVDNSEFTGVAVANLGTGAAVLKFTAFNAQGNLLRGSGIANPSQVTLGARNQLAMIDAQVFGAGLATARPVGWFKMESTIREAVGFFLVFNGSLGVQDGADVSTKTMANFVLPEIEDQGLTQIHVANPGASSTSVTLDLVEGSGSVRATASRTVAANGVLVESLSSLYPAVPSFDGAMYIRGSASSAVVPFEYLGKSGQYVEGVNGQDNSSGTRVTYSPQYVVGGPWRTTISIVNFENSATNVQLRLVGNNGTQLGTTRVQELRAQGKVQIATQNFFVTPDPISISEGYVEITSDRANIGGTVVFGDPGRALFSAALPLTSQRLNSAVFSQIANNANYFTGLAALNPGDSEASFLLEIFDRTGSLVQSRTFSLQGRRRMSELLTQYITNLPTMNSGYFRVTSAQGLLSFALIGTNTLSALSAVPAQTVP